MPGRNPAPERALSSDSAFFRASTRQQTVHRNGAARPGASCTRLDPWYNPPLAVAPPVTAHSGRRGPTSWIIPVSDLPLILILNGPNMNMLGIREPEIYGATSLKDVEAMCGEVAEELGLRIDFRQSNHEGELIDWVQEGHGKVAGIIVNPAGLTTTSISLMDALKAVDLPTVEVHISNIHRREEFRHNSYIVKAALGAICGLGVSGYRYALMALAEHLKADSRA